MERIYVLKYRYRYTRRVGSISGHPLAKSIPGKLVAFPSGDQGFSLFLCVGVID